MMTGKWVVLDIDGVLIDVSGSYDLAVKKTAELFLTNRGTEPKLDLSSIRSFRKRGKFGDDYKVTAGLILANLSGNFDDLISQFPRGGELNWIQNKVEAVIDREELRTAFDEFYRGTSNSPDQGEQLEGLWKQEEPLVEGTLLEETGNKFNLGYITGRNRKELKLAEKILNYQLQDAITREEFEKPDPGALAALVGDEDGVYIGDTYNDKLLVDNFNEKGGNFSFVQVNQNHGINAVLRKVLTG